MAQAAHTPTPWKFEDEYVRADALNGDEGGNIVADVYTRPSHSHSPEMEANAAFIVRAVNAHDALVEALEIMVGSYEDRQCWPGKKDVLLDKMNAVLALAKGDT